MAGRVNCSWLQPQHVASELPFLSLLLAMRGRPSGRPARGPGPTLSRGKAQERRVATDARSAATGSEVGFLGLCRSKY